jgi:hypothetical protein
MINATPGMLDDTQYEQAAFASLSMSDDSILMFTGCTGCMPFS